MGSFEQAFSDVERAATSTAKSASDLAKLAKALEKAAKDGNIAAIKRAQAGLGSAVDALRQEVSNSVAAWPFKEEQEEQYLNDHYSAELRTTAAEKGLEIYERDGRLISHPSIVRILPSSRAVRIDRKQTSKLRPSRLTETLIKNQKMPPRFQSGHFLEALYETYLLITETQQSFATDNHQRGVVPLEKIYRAFTSLPGSNRDYDRTDFARDLYHLDSSGPRQTRAGLRVSFPASTGMRGTSGVFSFVGPDGQLIPYYGIRFSKSE